MNPRLRAFALAAIVFVLGFNLAAYWQWRGGSHASEFGGHPDEAAHYVTGLMLRDYIGAGFAGHPLKYAQEYYRHYPKIGLGVWPPVFYAVQAGWEFACGSVQRLPVLLMMAALAGVLAAQIFSALRAEYGEWLAAVGALAFICLPLTIEHYSMIMAEILTGIFMFGATMAWGRFLDEGRARDSLLFGAFAGLAILTKGTGLALALTAPLALIATCRWTLLKRPALWGGALLTAVIAGPWTWLFRNYGRDKGGWLESSPSWNFTREATPYYLGKLGTALGGILLLFFCIGVLVKAVRPGPRRGLWAAAGALIAAVIIFQIVMPVGLEARHLLSALPAAIMFAIAGMDSLRDAWRHRRGLAVENRTVLSLGICTLAVGAGVWLAHRLAPPDPKSWTGMASMAEAVLNHPELRSRPILVCSDATGEGMFISELAMRDRRPGAIVLRASKETAAMDWAGRGARTKFNDDDLVSWLGKADVGCIVVDASMSETRRGPHHDQLIYLCENRTDIIQPTASGTVVRGGVPAGPVRLYVLRDRGN